MTNTITYENYTEALDSFVLLGESNLTEGFVSKLTGFKGQVGKFLLQVKGEIKTIAQETKIGLGEIVKALKNKDIFGVVKAIGFNLKNALKLINKGTNLFHKGYVKMFKELHKTKAFKKLASGTMKLDELLSKYPLLKKLTGPMVAGLLLIVWLNISFIGNFDYDFDVSGMLAALGGNYNLYDLFASPQGMAMLAFVATNIASGGMLSVTWLGAAPINFAMALIYTGLKRAGITNDPLKSLIKGKKKIKSFREWQEPEELEEMFHKKELKDLEIKIKRTAKLAGSRSMEILKMVMQHIKSRHENEVMPYSFKPSHHENKLYHLIQEYFFKTKTLGFINTTLVFDQISLMIE